MQTLGGLDTAANVIGDAVGDAYGPELHTQSLAGWEGTLAVSLRSVFLSLKYEIAHMIAHGGGSIANVTCWPECFMYRNPALPIRRPRRG